MPKSQESVHERGQGVAVRENRGRESGEGAGVLRKGPGGGEIAREVQNANFG